MNLTNEELARYSRNIALDGIGIEGQKKLINGKVLIIGVGGLGSPIAMYLAAAGVGTIGIVDGDVVKLSNLQRQIIHFTKDLNINKIDSAKEKIEAINPNVKVNIYDLFIKANNIREIIREYDFIIDGTDNFETKFLINDACFFENKPFSHGGILRFIGQTMTIIPDKTICYRCIFNKPPAKNQVPTCSQAGVLGSIAGMLGTIQATEAIKFLTNTGELLTNRLLTFDALKMKFRTIDFKINNKKSCILCGKNPKITELRDL